VAFIRRTIKVQTHDDLPNFFPFSHWTRFIAVDRHHRGVRIGFVVNPYAGMGGPLGLKGTDGVALIEALERGAKPMAGEKAQIAIQGALPLKDVEFITASGAMGAEVLEGLHIPFKVVYQTGDRTNGADTTDACRRFLTEGAELIVFCGGDGTARDVLRAVDRSVPVLGIPSGVKMHSGVFATTPRAAGELLRRFVEGGLGTKDGEVMDIDEEAFRSNRLQASLEGYMITLDEGQLMQPPKGIVAMSSDDEEKDELGEYFQVLLEWGTLYILGPGTTLQSIAKVMGEEKTLLGVDVLLDRHIVGKDLDEMGLLTLLEEHENVKVVVTPIGSQGFIFGRGNQQISAHVIRRIGLDNIIVVATPTKLKGMKMLRVDTGDLDLDMEFRGYRRVMTGYGRERVLPVQ
jgi:predicted polyphosphate/ATP-dependent NAD kinase